jgi:cell filamentation protein
MAENYKYVDSKYIYVDAETGILRNIPNFKSAEELLFFESVTVAKRIQELKNSSNIIIGIVSLFEIHKHLFQDVYEWAGEKRRVEISKDGKQFFLTNLFDTALLFIDNLILEYKALDKTDKNAIASKLAEILDNINYLHPFREGNGRAQREFIRTLALEKGFHLNLNPPDNKLVYDQYMHGTINSDLNMLTSLIFDQLKE